MTYDKSLRINFTMDLILEYSAGEIREAEEPSLTSIKDTFIFLYV